MLLYNIIKSFVSYFIQIIKDRIKNTNANKLVDIIEVDDVVVVEPVAAVLVSEVTGIIASLQVIGPITPLND